MTELKIGIEDDARKEIAGGLSRLLADSYALFVLTQNYHWNVTGPMFRSLHELFEEQYRELFESIDEIAERIRALGHFAPGSFKAFTGLTSLREQEPDVPKAGEMVARLVAAHEAVIRTARNVLPVANESRDEVTVDLLTQRLESHEKNAWMLRSMVEDPGTSETA